MIAEIKKMWREKNGLNQLVVEPCGGKRPKEKFGIRVHNAEMERLLSHLQLGYKSQLIGYKIYISDGKVYILSELEGDLEGDTGMPFVGAISNLNGENGKCVWTISGDTAGNPEIQIATEHAVVTKIQHMTDCIFPWDMRGKPAIYTGQQVYAMYCVN